MITIGHVIQLGVLQRPGWPLAVVMWVALIGLAAALSALAVLWADRDE